MEIIKPFLTSLLQESVESDNVLYRRNLLKDYIQVVILGFVYSQVKYSQMVFYGGSCLRHCFELPRLSEDLDFVDLTKKIVLSDLASDLETYFNKKTDLPVKINVQPSKIQRTQKIQRIQMKFPILKELGLADASESDLLYLKLEVFKEFDFCSNYEITALPVFKFNRSMIIRTFDLGTMMATKIGAVLNRQWEKIAKGGAVLANVKGRDYFDLVWYLNKNIKPNLNCFMNKKDKTALKENLLVVIAKVDAKSIEYDLSPLMNSNVFAKNFSKTVKEILTREIQEKL